MNHSTQIVCNKIYLIFETLLSTDLADMAVTVKDRETDLSESKATFMHSELYNFFSPEITEI